MTINPPPLRRVCVGEGAVGLHPNVRGGLETAYTPGTGVGTYGSRIQLPLSEMKFSRIHIPIQSGKKKTSLRALNTTVERFGWDVLDDGTGSLWTGKPAAGSYTRTRTVPNRGNWRGGQPMEICLTPVKQGRPRGQIFRFRVSKSTRVEQLARIAAATQGNWAWMTDLNGRRVDRADWLALGDVLYSRQQGVNQPAKGLGVRPPNGKPLKPLMKPFDINPGKAKNFDW